jgi:hypothetical protein
MRFLQSNYYNEEYVNNIYKIVSIDDISSNSSVRAFALAYLSDINALSNSIDTSAVRSLEIDGAFLDTTYFYIPFSYAPGINCLNIDSSLTTAKININKSLFKSGFSSSSTYLSNGDLSAGQGGSNGSAGNVRISYSYSIYISDAVLITKSYAKIANRLSYYYNVSEEEFNNTQFIKDNSYYASYKKCKAITYTIRPTVGDYPVVRECLILATLQDFEYLEDFSNDVYYSVANQDYYADPAFTQQLNLRIKYDYFPHLVLNESTILHGPVSQTLDINTDANLQATTDYINEDSYVSICNFSAEQTNPPAAGTGTIFCSLTDPNRAVVNYGGNAYYFLDNQICGTPAKTVLAVFTLKNYKTLQAYKDFTVLTSVLFDVYAYNFRYIKYRQGDTYYNFQDNGSVATTTVKYSNQVLDFTKYFSLKEQNDGLDSIIINAISFNFLIYKIATTDADATSYILDVPIQVLRPRYVGAEEKSPTKLIIKTDYATRISYYFGDDPSTAVSVPITTDSSDGSNQETEIDITGRTGDIHVDLFNYFYDVEGGQRELYANRGNTYQIQRDLVIPTFTFSIKQGGTTVNFYEESNLATSINQINITDASQSSFNNYILYSNYSNVGDFEFILTFSLPPTSSFVSLYLGSSAFPLNTKVQSGVGSVISKVNLFKLAKIDGSININFYLDGRIEYSLPFKFKNFSSNSPACDPIPAPDILLKNTEASAEFSFDYRYADSITYSLIDNNSNILYGPSVILEPYSAALANYFINGTTISRSLKVSNFPVFDNSTSIKVRVTVKNINASREDVEVTVDSSSFSAIPQKLNRQTPAEILFFSDQAMTTAVSTINKDILYYAFLQLYDVGGSAINSVNYGNYISTNPPPTFVMIESNGDNVDLEGVILNKVNDYLYSFKIPTNSSFNDEAFVIDALYLPIIDLDQK